MSFITKNWGWLATIAGIGIAREAWQRHNMIDLPGQVVMITGGSRGLGLAMAEEFARQGAKLVLCARQEDELEQARLKLMELESAILTVVCDVTNPEDVQHAVEQATARFGRIDILVNNAGIISAGPQQTLTRADFEESMNIMFWGVFNMTMAVLPQMKERHAGRIVNITSIGGKVSVPHLLPYCSAKFAATGFSEGLRAELAQDGISVTTVVPGLLRTGSQINTIIKGSKHKTEYTLFTLLDTLPASSISAKRAARQIVFATRRGTAELIISVQAQIFARVYGAFPGLTIDLLSVVNRFLPRGEGTAGYQGKESETPVSRSFLTRLGQIASRTYNELSNSRS
jgi:NAD(P)-dependent dehydrogenase (short-subunit alcohol dehydrogenase family)